MTELHGFDTITAPAGWASALVNGDESGFDYYQDAEDFEAYEAFCKHLEDNRLIVIDVVRDEDGNGLEPRFSWSCDLHWSAYRGGDLLDYVVQKLEPPHGP